MEDIIIKFEEDCITVTYGNRRMFLNPETFTPNTAICYALNTFGITKFSDNLIKGNLESVSYYKEQSGELSRLLDESLNLAKKLIEENELLKRIITTSK